MERGDRFEFRAWVQLSQLSVPVLTTPCNGLLVQTAAAIEEGWQPLIAIARPQIY